ncbi:MAG: hypothetical protein O3B86_13395 [Planctomycetota bacterium]|nr:hypothetical protein [Planctomycetota bacterium]
MWRIVATVLFCGVLMMLSLLTPTAQERASRVDPLAHPEGSAARTLERERITPRATQSAASPVPVSVRIPAVATRSRRFSALRTNVPDSRVALARSFDPNLDSDPEQFLVKTIASLTADVDDPVHQVTAIHDWIADKIAYDVDLAAENRRPPETWEGTIRKGSTVCSGYSRLFQKMCDLAGFRCEFIPGYSLGIQLEGPDALIEEDHAWNAVEIDGEWHLVDVTWAAGAVSGKEFKRRFSHDYLFLPPREFLHTHFPGDRKWQLIDPPITKDEFAQLPRLNGRFFNFGLEMSGGSISWQSVRDRANFELVVPEEYRLSCHLVRSDGEPLERQSLIQRTGSQCRVLVAFPESGQWTVQLFAQHREETTPSPIVGAVRFTASHGTTAKFPKLYGGYSAMRAGLLSPLYVPLSTGNTEMFRIRVDATNEVNLVADGSWLRMTPSPGNASVFEVKLRIPPCDKLRIVAKQGQKHVVLTEFMQLED